MNHLAQSTPGVAPPIHHVCSRVQHGTAWAACRLRFVGQQTQYHTSNHTQPHAATQTQHPTRNLTATQTTNTHGTVCSRKLYNIKQLNTHSYTHSAVYMCTHACVCMCVSVCVRVCVCQCLCV